MFDCIHYLAGEYGGTKADPQLVDELVGATISAYNAVMDIPFFAEVMSEPRSPAPKETLGLDVAPDLQTLPAPRIGPLEVPPQDLPGAIGSSLVQILDDGQTGALATNMVPGAEACQALDKLNGPTLPGHVPVGDGDGIARGNENSPTHQMVVQPDNTQDGQLDNPQGEQPGIPPGGQLGNIPGEQVGINLDLLVAIWTEGTDFDEYPTQYMGNPKRDRDLRLARRNNSTQRYI